MSDDASFYAQALRDADDACAIQELWAKAFADADGDLNRTKARYIKLRVAELTLGGGEGAGSKISAPGPEQGEAVPVRKDGVGRPIYATAPREEPPPAMLRDRCAASRVAREGGQIRHIPRYVRTLAQCVLWLAFAAHANVFVSDGDKIDDSTIVKITGEITKDDAAKISDLVRRGAQVEKKAPVQYRIFLNSRGGDLDAAMAIGRMLRTTTTRIAVATNEMKDDGPISMPGSPYDGWRSFSAKPATCASACVLILAAGSQRIAYVGNYNGRGNRVGLHRPYSMVAGGGTTAQGAARYTAIAAKVRAYLEEVGMPGRLYEEMMLVPPEKVRWLTLGELDSLGLIGSDPAYEDAMDSRAAALRGISKQEWLRRKSLADEACLPPKSGPFDSPEYKKWGDCLKHVYDRGFVLR